MKICVWFVTWGLFFGLIPAFPGGSSQEGNASPTIPITSTNNVPVQWTREFSTDFSIHSIDFHEILSGGPAKDGIPSIDVPEPGVPSTAISPTDRPVHTRPATQETQVPPQGRDNSYFETVNQAQDWIGSDETVLVLSLDGISRIYPLQILMWHEIVNDWIGNKPVTVTWCPLCNTAVGFERMLEDGTVLDFGTTGRLRYSNLLMYDRQTESWWQQAEGLAVIGQYTGTKLAIVPLLTLPFRTAKKQYPEGLVLSRNTGYHRAYGTNPYQNYDSLNNPFLYQGPGFDTSRPPMERALVIFLDEKSVSVAYSVVEESGLIEIPSQGGTVLVLWHPGVASPLTTSSVATGPDRGSANAFFSRTTEGLTVSLQQELANSELLFRDFQTGSFGILRAGLFPVH